MNPARPQIAIILVVLVATLVAVACAPAQTPAPPAQAPTSALPTSGIIAPAPTNATPGAGGFPTPSAEDANADLKVARIQGFGLFLTDKAGRTLYAFAVDTKDTSNCSGACAQNWPPFAAQSKLQVQTGLNSDLVGSLTRADGATQVTYDGHPLYYYSGDKNPGDVNGQGIGNVWHVLSPRGNPMNNSVVPKATPTP